MLNKDKIFLYFDRAIIACLCLLIFCLPFTKAGVEIFVWSAIFLWIFKRVLGYRAGSLWGMFPKTELNEFLGIFIAVNALSVIFSVHLGLSLRGFFGKELKFLAIYFMLVEVINSRERLKNILIAIIASAILTMVDAGVQYFRGVDFLRGYQLDYHTFGASFSTASDFAGWLIVIIPIFIGIIAVNIIPSLKLKILLSVSIIIQSSYLLRTYSRGAWLGFLIGISLMVYYVVKNSTLRIKTLCISVVICLLFIYSLLPRSVITKAKDAIRVNFKFSQGINDRVKSIPQTNRGTNLVRIMLWKESLRIIRDYPLFGCGLNNYSIVARNYKSFEGGGIYPHNSFLQMAAETGLLGLFAFFLLLFGFFIIEMKHLNKENGFLALGLLSGILAFLVHAFFDTHLYSLKLVVLFWYMIGLTIAVIKLDQNTPRL